MPRKRQKQSRNKKEDEDYEMRFIGAIKFIPPCFFSKDRYCFAGLSDTREIMVSSLWEAAIPAALSLWAHLWRETGVYVLCYTATPFAFPA